jgi:hypothetical protein
MVVAAVAATQASIADGQAAVADATAAGSLGLAGSAAAARAEVQSAMATMSHFDPFLRFASPQDEEDYRRREAARSAYIEAELARGTPQGDLNASAGVIGQMVDAKANGAGDSPEFQQRWRDLVATTQRLRDEVRRSGGSTTEFDNRLREDLRRILKAKGLSEAQIDAQFAANPDPLEAAKAFVNDGDVETISAQSARRADSALESGKAETIATTAPVVAPGTLDNAISDLKGFGFAAAEHDPANDPAHGVTLASAASTGVTVKRG